jgi:hypothetical protein
MAKARKRKAVKTARPKPATAKKRKAARKTAHKRPAARPAEQGFFESFLALFAPPSEGRKR